MTQSTVQPKTKKSHPAIEVIKVFWGAYIRELRSRNTIGYRAKGEVAATAMAIHNGIEALRNHDPNKDAKLARERALADENIIEHGPIQ